MTQDFIPHLLARPSRQNPIQGTSGPCEFFCGFLSPSKQMPG
jgi:hypothetical protein